MAVNNASKNNASVNVAPSGSTPANVEDTGPVRRSSRLLKKDASPEDAKEINEQLQYLSLESSRPNVASSITVPATQTLKKPKKSKKSKSRDRKSNHPEFAETATACTGRKAVYKFTKYNAQGRSFFTILPIELRIAIYKYCCQGMNTDTPLNTSYIRLPEAIRCCKQLFAEISLVFHTVNTFKFAVGSNFSASDGTRQELNLSGTLGMRRENRRAALNGFSQARLSTFVFEIYPAMKMIQVFRDIRAYRKGVK